MGNDNVGGLCNCSDATTGNHDFYKSNNKAQTLENGKLAKESDYSKSKGKVLILDLPEYSPKGDMLSHFDATTSHSLVDANQFKIRNVRLELGDNNFYEGPVFENLFEGKGRLVLNEEIYIGEFSKGMKNGKGELYDLKNNLKYKGEYKDNKKHGFGKKK
jgi:hypothetical protein